VTFLDLLLALVILCSIVTGFTGGFARAGVGFCAVIAGLLFGFWFYGIPGAWIDSYFHSPTASNFLGFVVVFVAFVVFGSLIGALLAKIFRWTGLSWLDRLLGAGFGIVRGALIAVALVSVLVAFAPRPLPDWIVHSRLLPWVARASDITASLAPKAVKEAYRDTLAEIRKLWDEQLRDDQLRHEQTPPEPDRQKSYLKKSDA
jgi:membrane protein required for colicin V production